MRKIRGDRDVTRNRLVGGTALAYGQAITGPQVAGGADEVVDIAEVQLLADDRVFGYDADGQLTSVAYASGASKTFAYDADGNLVTSTHTRNGRTLTITYSYTAGDLTGTTEVLA